MYDEEFLNQFNKNKIKSWDNNYINYISLCNKIKYIEEKYNNNNSKIELGEEEVENDNEDVMEIENGIELQKSNLNNISNNLIKEDEENMSIIENLSNKGNDNNTSNTIIEEKKIKKFKKPTKKFMNLLDKEIKKMHAFYISKETDLFEGTSSQIELYDTLKSKENTNDKKIKIISDIKYLSKLGQSLIDYVYLNIKALKNILNIYDKKIISISYQYIQKHLTKNNGDLVYILRFKTLDECLLAINELFNLIKDNLNEEKAFKNNKELSELFDNEKEEITLYIQNAESTYNSIFEELSNWKKYLNMSLEMPSSSYHSIFKNTSYLGDSSYNILNLSIKNKSKLKKGINNNNIFSHLYEENNKTNLIKKENIINELKNEDKNNIIQKKDFDEIGEKNENNTGKKDFVLDNDLMSVDSSKSSNLFRGSDTNSYKNISVLSRINLSNLNLLKSLIPLYSFSLSFIIPQIIIFLKMKNNFQVKDLSIYGVIISITNLGNLLSKIIFHSFLKKSFKIVLVFSSFFILVYYILLILGTYYDKKSIILIPIGRFLLGFSIVKHLSKTYINQNVPISNQINLNQSLKFFYYCGYSAGFLFNSLYAIKWKFTIFDLDIKIITIIYLVFFLYGLLIFIIIWAFFYEPSKYPMLRDSLLKFNQRHRLSKAFLVQNEEKEITDKLEKTYFKANDETNQNELNKLEKFVNENKDNPYYTKIKIILFILLISSEYTSENLLLLIPRLMAYDIDNEDNISKNNIIIFSPIILCICYILCYILQIFNSINKRLKKHKIKNIILILIILLISHGSLYFILFGQELKNELCSFFLIPGIGTILMILLNEVYHFIIINLFIKLLPSEKIEFCCFYISTAINVITKITKIVPALIKLISYFIHKDDFEKILLIKSSEKCLCNFILFGIQIINYIICLFLVTINHSFLKGGYRNRLLFLDKMNYKDIDIQS